VEDAEGAERRTAMEAAKPPGKAALSTGFQGVCRVAATFVAF